jgi:hypothetical protein
MLRPCASQFSFESTIYLSSSTAQVKTILMVYNMGGSRQDSTVCHIPIVYRSILNRYRLTINFRQSGETKILFHRVDSVDGRKKKKIIR